MTLNTVCDPPIVPQREGKSFLFPKSLPVAPPNPPASPGGFSAYCGSPLQTRKKHPAVIPVRVLVLGDGRRDPKLPQRRRLLGSQLSWRFAVAKAAGPCRLPRGSQAEAPSRLGRTRFAAQKTAGEDSLRRSVGSAACLSRTGFSLLCYRTNGSSGWGW